MQILLFFLLTASVGALPQSYTTIGTPALATTTSINSTTTPAILEKRSHHPWIGNFDNDKCSGKHTGSSRPEIPYGRCVQFAPSGQFFSVYWGSFPLNILALQLFSGPKCEQGTTVKILFGHKGGHTCEDGAKIPLGFKSVQALF